MTDRVLAIAAVLLRTSSRVPAFVLFAISTFAGSASAQDEGSIHGLVYSRDFDFPLAEVTCRVLKTGQEVKTNSQGEFLIPNVEPGVYILVFIRQGYVREVKSDVVVGANQQTELGVVTMQEEYTELDEFLVEDVLSLAGGAETALLQLRYEAPAMMDSIGAELMSRAGASDAASALRLVSGATVTNGKFAVIRGLPDRYVSGQLNGARLPSADQETRAVELDQFPSAIIESVQVTKTFTPDQQGDASGGAVDVRLKSIPDEPILQFRANVSVNTNVAGGDFVSYQGGGVSGFGFEDIDPQENNTNWTGALGATDEDSPIDWKWSGSAGTKRVLDNGLVVGGLLNLYYERDSSFFDDGQRDSLTVEDPEVGLVPETFQGEPQPDSNPPGAGGEFLTRLYDITQASQQLQWGGLLSLGMETDNHKLGLSYLYSRTAQDTTTIAIDQRGKDFFFPGYDPNDPEAPGNVENDLQAASWQRNETLEYEERATGSLQLRGDHTFTVDEQSLGSFTFQEPQVNWLVASSFADLSQPDKRQFGTRFSNASFEPGRPPFTQDETNPAAWSGLKPGLDFTLGNLQRSFLEIEEDSNLGILDVKLPFEQWDDEDGYIKLGAFVDRVERSYREDTFSNFGDNSSYVGEWDDPWSLVFPFENNHEISEALVDIDYDGEQDITAWYGMIDLPLSPTLTMIGGARLESTSIDIEVRGEDQARWFPPGEFTPISLNGDEADVAYSQHDVLPALSLLYEPVPDVTLRAAYSETVARQTFRELTPVLQQEFIGGPVFIGNPELEMSAVTNYDLRFDYRPHAGGLYSISWFQKDLDQPIELVQRVTATEDFTTAVNYPTGQLSGFEFEIREDLSEYWDVVDGLSAGVNYTLIDSRVRISPEEEALLGGLGFQQRFRDMTNAPERLYNIFVTYDHEDTETQLALFYTVRGDTLVAGPSIAASEFVPSIYEQEFDTLNFSLSKRWGKYMTLKFQAKNLTNPEIRRVFRSEFTEGDTLRATFTRGREFSFGLTFAL